MALIDDLISWWELGEATGTGARADSHGLNDLSANDGGGNAASVAEAAGVVGNAAQFSGSNQLRHADNADLSTGDVDLTVVAWFYVPTGMANTGAGIVHKFNFGTFEGEYSIIYDNSFGAGNEAIVTRWRPLTSSVLITSPPGQNATFAKDSWHMVAFRHDAANDLIRLRVDATNETAVATGGASPADLTGTFILGRNAASGFRIDQVAFWKRHLSDSELDQIYNSGAGVSYDDIATVGTSGSAATSAPAQVTAATGTHPPPPVSGSGASASPAQTTSATGSSAAPGVSGSAASVAPAQATSAVGGAYEAAVLLSDDLIDADGTPAVNHPPDLGGPWVTATGDTDSWYQIEGNRIRSTAGSKGAFVNVGVPDVTVRGTLDVGAGNLMSLRVASGSDAFTGGMRVRLSATSDEVVIFDPAGNVIATVSKAIAPNTAYPFRVDHYRGHLVADVDGTRAHGWLYDYILSGVTFDYASLVPTGTRVGPDWSSAADGYLGPAASGVYEVREIAASDAARIACIGDSITPFNRAAVCWPRLVGERHNGGITQVRTFCGGGEGLSKPGTSGNTALEQAQLILADAGATLPTLVPIHIGTNDDVASVTATGKTVQVLMTEVLDELLNGGVAASAIKVMSILPNTTESYHAANRTAIATACASRGVTVLDTSRWGFDPTPGVHTSDGLHPNDAGHELIATKFLAGLSGRGRRHGRAPLGSRFPVLRGL